VLGGAAIGVVQAWADHGEAFEDHAGGFLDGGLSGGRCGDGGGLRVCHGGAVYHMPGWHQAPGGLVNRGDVVDGKPRHESGGQEAGSRRHPRRCPAPGARPPLLPAMTQPVGGPPAPQVVVPGAGWVDVASRAITQVGFPIVVACVLLWFVIFKFGGQVELVSDRLMENGKLARDLIEVQRTEIVELQRQTGELQKQTESLGRISEKLERMLGMQQKSAYEIGESAVP